MKIIKKILIAIGVLIALILIVALFVPKKFSYEANVDINKPLSEVFDYIKQVKNQDNFGVWQLSDPNMEKSFLGTDGTVGFTYSWKGKKAGKGSQKITAIEPSKQVSTELDFGFGKPANSYFITQEKNAVQTNVTWGIKGESPYPFNIMNLFFNMDKDFEQGLQNLKAVLENRSL